MSNRSCPIALVFTLFCAAQAGAINLIAGGDFDSNADLANWIVGNDGGGANPIIQIGVSNSLGPQAGAGYLAFTGNDVSEDGFAEQVVNVLPGQSHELTFYYAARGAGVPSVTVTASGAATGDLYSQQFSPPTIGDWTKVTERFTPTTNTVTIRFQESSANSVNKGPAIDTASLTMVPVPTTMAMLDMAEFTTAADNGQSPAAAGQFNGPLYVRERANENDPQLEVEAFIKFDLTGLDPRGIVSATLVLHENHKLNNANSADMSIARVIEAWDASGNDPVFAEETALNDGPGGITDVLDEFVFGNNGPASAGPAVDIFHNIDITTWARLWQADSLSNHGIRLRIDDAFVGAAFDHTGANRVQLIIKQVAPIPEPATATLGLIALGSLMRRRRRAA